jgi:hypothetical protein
MWLDMKPAAPKTIWSPFADILALCKAGDFYLNMRKGNSREAQYFLYLLAWLLPLFVCKPVAVPSRVT